MDNHFDTAPILCYDCQVGFLFCKMKNDIMNRIVHNHCLKSKVLAGGHYENRYDN